MKKLYLLAATALVCGISATAQETVKTLYDGEAMNVSWSNTLTIPAEKFAEDVKVGDFISIGLENAQDVLEIKANGTWLPGSILSRIDGKDEFRAYITTDMLSTMKEYGMEICGGGFTLTSVSVKNDGFNMPEGAIWGGFFWVENWNTLELFKTAFDTYNGQRYLEINMEAGYDTYFFKALTKWDDDSAVWSNDANTVKEDTKVTLDLKDIKVKEALSDVNALMCQFNPEGGNPFNVTSIVLKADSESGVEQIENSELNPSHTVYNIQGIAVKTNVDSRNALNELPQGLYIINGKKFVKK
ncbi:MAG: hypothetical protein K2J87_02055 [Muribaculaceae bacterium]|nr:hypothetical protein [Muribaculaceae bacterium]